jgi:hypothetical protein
MNIAICWRLQFCEYGKTKSNKSAGTYLGGCNNSPMRKMDGLRDGSNCRFGMMGRPPLTFPDGTQVRGAIDMIEERDGQLRVTDHKTGRVQPPFGFTRNGEVLQPLLYAQAAEMLLSKPVTAARLFYCTQRAGYKADEIAITDLAREYLWKVIEIITESLSQGFIPAAPRADACKYCDFSIVCGPYEETRIHIKKTDRLRLLEQLRSIP